MDQSNGTRSPELARRDAMELKILARDSLRESSERCVEMATAVADFQNALVRRDKMGVMVASEKIEVAVEHAVRMFEEHEKFHVLLSNLNGKH